MSQIILDTSAWYAFLFASDAFHKQAVQVIENQPHLLVPYPVFEELAALVHHRAGKKIASKGVGKLLQSHSVEILYPTDEDTDEIWKIYTTAPTYLDFVDCAAIWASRKFELPVFTYDDHFRKAKVPLVQDS